MRLHELLKVLESPYILCMNNIADAYEIITKLGGKVDDTYDWQSIKYAIEDIPGLDILSNNILLLKNIDINLIINLKVLKITNDYEIMIYVGYEKFHT